MRLIDADALSNAMFESVFGKVIDEHVWTSRCWIRYKMFEWNIGNAPTIDAVPVVRCKDCKHYRYYGLEDTTVSECTIDHCENPDEEWFCADGEREKLAGNSEQGEGNG